MNLLVFSHSRVMKLMIYEVVILNKLMETTVIIFFRFL